jgi:hypothetical protein
MMKFDPLIQNIIICNDMFFLKEDLKDVALDSEIFYAASELLHWGQGHAEQLLAEVGQQLGSLVEGDVKRQVVMGHRCGQLRGCSLNQNQELAF